MTDILNYNNSEVNKKSANSTLSLTQEMQNLTSKSVQETVMMRIIALVTVIFLPGTFISVSIQRRCDTLG